MQRKLSNIISTQSSKRGQAFHSIEDHSQASILQQFDKARLVIPGLNLANLQVRDQTESIQKLKGIKMALDEVRKNIRNSSNHLYDSQSNLVAQSKKANKRINNEEQSHSVNDLFKSRVLPDIKLVELNKMFEDPEYIEKYPEMVSMLTNPNMNLKSHQQSKFNSSKSNTINFESNETENQGSYTVREAKKKAKKQNVNNEDNTNSSTRDRSYAKLLKKIQETSRTLKATKNGKSIFTSNSSLDNQKSTKISQFSQTQTSSIPLFAQENLRKDFNKLLELNGPKYPQQFPSRASQNLKSFLDNKNNFQIDPKSFNQSQLIIVEETQNTSSFLNDDKSGLMYDLTSITNAQQKNLPFIQQQSFNYDFQKAQVMQPPIGLTARLSPRQLRQKFQFPEFQNKIIESVGQTGKGGKKRHLSVNNRKKSIINTQRYQRLDSTIIDNSLESTVSQRNTNYQDHTYPKPPQPQSTDASPLLKALPDIIRFCRQENIAFTDSEKMHYDIFQTKKNHRLYSKCLRHCFKSSYQDDIQMAQKSMQRLENVLSRPANDKVQVIMNNIDDLQSIVEDIQERKELIKAQVQRENQQKRLIQELQTKIDDPTANERFSHNFKQNGAKAKTNQTGSLQSSLPQLKELKKNERKKQQTDSSKHSKLDGLEKTQKRMQRSKVRLSKELMKVLEKVDIDRTLTFREKASVILKDNPDQSLIESPSSIKAGMNNISVVSKGYSLSKSNKKLEQSQILEDLKKSNKKQLDTQRHAYMMLLDYIKVRSRTDRNSRVSESERKIFDTIKTICEGSWIIHGGEEFLKILNEINIYNDIDEQTYFFIWYAFELLGFDCESFDTFLTEQFKIDLSFAKQRKCLFQLVILQQQSQQQTQQKHYSLAKEIGRQALKKSVLNEFFLSNIGSRSEAKRMISIGDQ